MIQLQEYFTVKYKPYHQNTERQLPYVSRTSMNQGVSGIAKTQNIVPKGTISVACSGSVLESFYHDYEYAIGKDVYYLEPKVSLTLNEKLYYCMLIKANKYKYNFGRQANRTLKSLKLPKLNQIPKYVNKIKIQIPYMKNSTNFQGNCQSSNQTAHLCERETDEFLISQRKSINNTCAMTQQKFDSITITEKSCNWRYFKMTDLFSITKGTESIRMDDEGDIPLVSATVNNNGIIAKINTNKKTYQNCLTITSSATPATTFYQEQPFTATESINICIPKFEMNKYVALFLVTILNMERFKFNYARKYSKTRMFETHIKLPSTIDNKPDYIYMEQYVKELEYGKNV